jgi:hypothetical protein
MDVSSFPAPLTVYQIDRDNQGFCPDVRDLRSEPSV